MGEAVAFRIGLAKTWERFKEAYQFASFGLGQELAGNTIVRNV